MAKKKATVEEIKELDTNKDDKVSYGELKPFYSTKNDVIGTKYGWEDSVTGEILKRLPGGVTSPVDSKFDSVHKLPR